MYEIRPEHFDSGKLACHPVKVFRKFPESFQIFKMDFGLKISVGYSMDRLNQFSDRAQRNAAERQGQNDSDKNADHSGLNQKRYQRRIRMSGKQTGSDSHNNHPVADYHGEEKKKKNQLNQFLMKLKLYL